MLAADLPLAATANDAGSSASERALRREIRLLRGRGRAKPLARATRRLGAVLLAAGRYQEAAAVLTRALRLAEEAFGKNSVEVARPLNQLGVCFKNLGRFAEAGQAYQRALHLLERRLGRDHAAIAALYHNLGGLEHAAGNGMRGEPFAREALRIRLRTCGRRHPEVAADMAALAALLDQQKKDTEAEALYREALAIYERAYGPDHPDLAASLNNLAAIHQAHGKVRGAEAMYRRALAITRNGAGPEHPKVAFYESNLAALLLQCGRPVEAELLCRQALATFKRRLGSNHPSTAVCLENYGAVLRALKRQREADTVARRAARILAGIDAVNDDGVAATATINPLRASFCLFVRPSPVHRFGVFTGEAIPQDRKVIEYTGERIARREAKRRWDPTRSYLFQLDSYWALDGAVGGSGAEYINHSCAPNLVTRLVRGHLFYFSKRRIERGEELAVDYKYDSDLPPMRCRCGSATCRGTMNLPRQARSAVA